MMVVKRLQTRTFLCLIVCFLAQRGQSASTTVGQTFSQLPVTFDGFSFDESSETLEWTVEAPYFDTTWADAHEFTNEDWINDLINDANNRLPDALRTQLPEQYFGVYGELANVTGQVKYRDCIFRVNICDGMVTIDLTMSQDTGGPQRLLTSIRIVYSHVFWQAVYENGDEIHWAPVAGDFASVYGAFPQQFDLGDPSTNEAVSPTDYSYLGSSVLETRLDEIYMATSTRNSQETWLHSDVDLSSSLWLNDLSSTDKDELSSILGTIRLVDVNGKVAVDRTTAGVQLSPPIGVLRVYLDTVATAETLRDELQVGIDRSLQAPALLGPSVTGYNMFSCLRPVLPVHMNVNDIPSPTQFYSSAIGTSSECQDYSDSSRTTIFSQNIERIDVCHQAVKIDIDFFVGNGCTGDRFLRMSLVIDTTGKEYRGSVDGLWDVRFARSSFDVDFTFLNGYDHTSFSFINGPPTPFSILESTTPGDGIEIRFSSTFAVNSRMATAVMTVYDSANLLNDVFTGTPDSLKDRLNSQAMNMYTMVSYDQVDQTHSPFQHTCNWIGPIDQAERDAFIHQQVVVRRLDDTPHPALVSFLDFGIDLTGPQQTPRTFASGVSRCASIRDSSDEGAGEGSVDPDGTGGFDRWLRQQMRLGQWTGLNHPSQALFDTPGVEYDIDSTEAGLLINGLSVLPWKVDASVENLSVNGVRVVQRIEPTIISTVVPIVPPGSGFNPFPNEGSTVHRHGLRYHCAVRLSDLMTCLTPWSDPVSGDPIPAVETSNVLLSDDQQYVIYSSWIGLGPSSSYGARGSMRSQTTQLSLTIGQYAWTAQQSTTGTRFYARVVDAASLAGSWSIDGSDIGCSSGNEGRVHLELELFHQNADTITSEAVLGVPTLHSISAVSDDINYDNCYQMPSAQPDFKAHFSSLDNWELSNSRRPWEPPTEAVLAGQTACSAQQNLAGDDQCNNHGAPFCVDGLGGCFQKAILTSDCLTLQPDGLTLSQSTCPNPDNVPADDITGYEGAFLLEFIIFQCPTPGDWTTLVRDATIGNCEVRSPQRLKIGLFNFKMFPVPDSVIATGIDLTTKLLPTRSTSDFDGVVSLPLTDANIVAPDSDIILATKLSSSALVTVLPIAIHRVILCRGSQSEINTLLTATSPSRTISDAMTDVVSGGGPCLADPDSQSAFLYDASNQLTSDGTFDAGCSSSCQTIPTCNGSPCLLVGDHPKPLVAAQDPIQYQVGNSVYSSFPVCDGVVGCDALAVPMTNLVSLVGEPEEDESILMVAQVFLGTVIPSGSLTARRRLLSTLTSSVRPSSYHYSAQVLALSSGDPSSSPTPTPTPSPQPSTPDPTTHVPSPTTVLQEGDNDDDMEEKIMIVSSAIIGVGIVAMIIVFWYMFKHRHCPWQRSLPAGSTRLGGRRSRRQPGRRHRPPESLQLI